MDSVPAAAVDRCDGTQRVMTMQSGQSMMTLLLLKAGSRSFCFPLDRVNLPRKPKIIGG